GHLRGACGSGAPLAADRSGHRAAASGRPRRDPPDQPSRGQQAPAAAAGVGGRDGHRPRAGALLRPGRHGAGTCRVVHRWTGLDARRARDRPGARRPGDRGPQNQPRAAAYRTERRRARGDRM
ncbi:MAG: Transcriptional regulator, ArsR family, partial [uncultured Nocardioidaceae bacterium]